MQGQVCQIKVLTALCVLKTRCCIDYYWYFSFADYIVSNCIFKTCTFHIQILCTAGWCSLNVIYSHHMVYWLVCFAYFLIITHKQQNIRINVVLQYDWCQNCFSLWIGLCLSSCVHPLYHRNALQIAPSH